MANTPEVSQDLLAIINSLPQADRDRVLASMNQGDTEQGSDQETQTFFAISPDTLRVPQGANRQRN